MFDLDFFLVRIGEIDSFGEFLSLINAILIGACMILYLHHNIFLILSLFVKPKKYKDTTNNHFYGYLISARNEEKVIGNLIDSIFKQDYPKELMRVYVIADNCTDNTASIAKEHGAIVIERNNLVKVGKSYALDDAFKHIIKVDKDVEAFIVFDADNLVDKNFTKEMNKAYESGALITTGYRDAKNYGQNWLASGAAMLFYRENRTMHRARSFLNSTCYVSGTGFMVDRSIIEDINGWPYHLLIEDVEFSIAQYLKGIKTEFVAKAIYYDEHPTKLKASVNQRLRWCKGGHQCSLHYQFKLFKNLFKNGQFSNIDLGTHIFPMPMIMFCWLIILPIIYGIYALIAHLDVNTWFHAGFMPLVDSLFYGSLYTLFVSVLLTIILWKDINAKWYKKILHSLTFPLYMLTYLPITTIAAFKKVKWVPIEHVDNKSIEDFEQ